MCSSLFQLVPGSHELPYLSLEAVMEIVLFLIVFKKIKNYSTNDNSLLEINHVIQESTEVN